MPARVHILPAAQCLSSALIDNLRDMSREVLRDTILLLPTQRLGTFVLASLLKTHRALVPPRILTLEQLLQEQGPRDRQVIADGALDLLIARLLREGDFQHLRSGHERELRLLYGELYDHGLRNLGMERLKQALREDIYKSEAHLGSLYDRAQEIEIVLKSLDELLLQRGLISRQAFLASSAEGLARRWQDNPIPATQYVLGAYTSLASSWQILLDTWLQDEHFAFWLSQAPELYHASSPLKELNQRIQSKVPIIAPREEVIAARKLLAAAVPHPLEETRWALQCIQTWIQQGFSPESLAILITDEKRYAPLLAAAMREPSFEANLALAFPFASSVPGRCLQAIDQLWMDDEELDGVLRLLAQAPLQTWLAKDQARTEDPSQYTELLAEALLRTQIPGSIQRLQKTLAEPWNAALHSLAILLSPLHPKQSQSLDLWIAALQHCVESLDLWNTDEDAELLRSAEEAFDNFLETLQVLRDSEGAMDGAMFWELVRSHLLASDIRRTGEPLSGVQVLILTEARYVPFQAAIILGCQEGSFPKALPQDELLDNYLKKAMGLPGWEVLEAMEDQTFHLLKARLPHLLLLRSLRSGEEALVRSRFVEALLIKKDSEEQIWPATAWKSSGLIQAQDLVATPEGCLEMPGEALRRHMSASRLELLIRCPYAFLLASLDVRGLESPPPWGDSRREGEWLHALLETLLTGIHKNQKILEPWPHASSTDIASEALPRLVQLSHLLAPPELRESALFTHLLDFAWPRFAQHLASLWPDPQLAKRESRREYEFKEAARQPARILLGQRERFLQGRIDAIDVQQEWVNVTDYKRRNPPSKKESGNGTAPQLAFYALALDQLQPEWNERGLLFGYWNIYKGEWSPQAVSTRARAAAERTGLAKKESLDLEVLKQSLLDIWEWREAELDAHQRFYADPSDCRLCSYTGICRKGDPRYSSQVEGQQRLQAYRQEPSDDQ